MGFKDDISSHGFGLLAERHGKSVTHIDTSSKETALTVIWQPDRTMRGFYPDGREDKQYGIIKINPADLTTYTIKDRFKIDNVIWAIETIGREGAVLDMQLSTSTVDFVGQDNYLKRL